MYLVAIKLHVQPFFLDYHFDKGPLLGVFLKEFLDQSNTLSVVISLENGSGDVEVIRNILNFLLYLY